MIDVEYKPMQRATQKLDHGRIVWEIDDSTVVRFRNDNGGSVGDSQTIPEIEFVGEGLATYEVKMIYQPSPNSFPCLVSNPRFTLRVFWNEEAEEYLATPAHSGEMNRSSEWLEEGVRTMNALHEFWRGANDRQEFAVANTDELSIAPHSQSGASCGWRGSLPPQVLS